MASRAEQLRPPIRSLEELARFFTVSLPKIIFADGKVLRLGENFHL
jgi:hypothetical protein